MQKYFTNGLFLRVKVSNQSRSVQFAHVPDHGASVTVKTGGFLLIKLVVQHKVGLFRVQPALVGVLRAFVSISTRLQMKYYTPYIIYIIEPAILVLTTNELFVLLMTL